MRQSRSWSKFLVPALATAFAFGGSALAQDVGDAAAEAGVEKQNSLSLLMGILIQNMDAVFVVIILLSMVAMTLIISSALRLRRQTFMPDASIEQMRGMIEQRQFKELIEYTENDPTFVAKALNPALKRAPSFAAMKEAMETAIGEQSADQFRKIEYLNIIGNLGPLLGLLGTVLGMIEAFSAMQRAGAGGANPAVLAGGISKALAHTFMGLFLAIPALAAFGILRTITDKLTIRAALVAEELLLMIKPAEAKPAAKAATAAGPHTGTTPPPASRPRVAAPVPQPPSASTQA
jgi:biopolymer transport protein ExbB